VKAPFPWFGGKSGAAEIVWQALGADVASYVEPFAGSLAVLLNRPAPPRTETVNDADCYLANFWRAAKHAPAEVAEWCDWPVNEADLSARHQWLVDSAAFREAMKTDPHHFDAKIAGWWVWGLCAWIGTGWCAEAKWRNGDPGQGVHRKLPHVGGHGRGVHRKHDVFALFDALAARLRGVRVACGDWSRVMGAALHPLRGQPAGVLLDPPYPDHDDRVTYTGGGGVFGDVLAWALENGDRADLRLVLCCYEGQADLSGHGWRSVPWKMGSGYQNQGTKGATRRLEVLWLSPHCLQPPQQQELSL